MVDQSPSLLRWSQWLRTLAAGILAGIACGVVAGIGARIAMRIVALAAGHRPSFSVGGSIAILIPNVLLGIPAGVLFIALRRWLPGPRLIKGLVLGLVLVLLFTWPFAAGNAELAISPRLGLGLFVLLFVIGSVTVALVTTPLERRLPLPRQNPVSLAGYSILMLLGIAGMIFLILVVVSSVLGSVTIASTRTNQPLVLSAVDRRTSRTYQRYAGRFATLGQEAHEDHWFMFG